MHDVREKWKEVMLIICFFLVTGAFISLALNPKYAHGTDEAIVKAGKEVYNKYCIICHGEKGDGQGALYVNKKYPYPPSSLLSEKMMPATEGDMYHVITVGHGIMAEHGSMIQQDDRWKIAMYIKKELQK